MQTKRQKQVAELIKRNISIVLQQDGSYIYGAGILVTVTGVKMSPDMGIAKIYLSIYNTENKQAVVLQLENENTRVRQGLAYRIRKHVRRIPEIQFYMDDTLDEMYRLGGLFQKLDKDGQLGKEEEE